MFYPFEMPLGHFGIAVLRSIPSTLKDTKKNLVINNNTPDAANIKRFIHHNLPLLKISKVVSIPQILNSKAVWDHLEYISVYSRQNKWL